MQRKINCQEKILLKLSIEKALRDAIQHAFIVRTKKLEEPDYIAALCLYFTKELYNIFNNFFRGSHTFSTTGIFCHQKPMAKFKGGRSCEIGDLLFVYIYRDKTGGEYYNALLLQAKKHEKEIIEISKKNELRQLELYSKWPKFTYWRADELNGKKRDILPKIFNSGAKYMLIDSDIDLSTPFVPNEYIFGTAIANNPLVLTNQLSQELIDFVGFKSGRVFEKRPNGIGINDETWTKDEWSKLIWDMINISKKATANRKNIRLSDFPRKTDAGNLFYFSQHRVSNFNLTLFDDPGNNNEDFIFDCSNEEPSGLPMIIIESQEMEKQER